MRTRSRNISGIHPPFWPRAVPFYALALGSSLLLFLLVLVALNDEPEEYRYAIPAVSAGILFLGIGLFREIIMRRARTQFIKEQRALERNLAVSGFRGNGRKGGEKLSLEQHAKMISEIRAKSEAALVLDRVAVGHSEVSKLCEAYIARIAKELPRVSSRSPRLAAFRKGKREVRRFHRTHFLRWAELETRALTRQANECANILERLELTEMARATVADALMRYPAERQLLESREILDELVISIRVAEQMQHANAARENGRHGKAVSHFSNARAMIPDPMLEKPDFASLASSLDEEIRKSASEVDDPGGE